MFHPVELLHEWEIRANRPLLGSPVVGEYAKLWVAGGEGGAESAFLPFEVPTRLMVVLTTFGRPSGAAHVLERLALALEQVGLQGDVSLLVLHDACGADYSAAREVAQQSYPRHVWLDARQHLGKRGFWRVHQTALMAAQAWQAERTLYLQDDLDFGTDLLERANTIWDATATDPERRVLYLFSSNDDENDGRWIRFPRRNLPELQCRQTNWFDLQAFMVDRAFQQMLGYRMVPIHPNRWKRQPDISSGVGRQFTLRASGRASVYQAWPSLVRHGALPSTMNAAARSRRPLDNSTD